MTISDRIKFPDDVSIGFIIGMYKKNDQPTYISFFITANWYNNFHFV